MRPESTVTAPETLTDALPPMIASVLAALSTSASALIAVPATPPIVRLNRLLTTVDWFWPRAWTSRLAVSVVVSGIVPSNVATVSPATVVVALIRPSETTPTLTPSTVELAVFVDVASTWTALPGVE